MSTTTTTSIDTAGDVQELRARREAAGLTRLELARRAGISLTWLQTIEGGVVPRRSQAVACVLAALHEAEDRPTNESGPVGKPGLTKTAGHDSHDKSYRQP